MTGTGTGGDDLTLFRDGRGLGVPDCLYCNRLCERCDYPIDGGFEHVEQPQHPEANVVVCEVRRVVRPLAEVLILWLTHRQEHARPHAVEAD